MIQFNVMFRTGDERNRREKSVGIGKSSHLHIRQNSNHITIENILHSSQVLSEYNIWEVTAKVIDKVNNSMLVRVPWFSPRPSLQKFDQVNMSDDE